MWCCFLPVAAEVGGVDPLTIEVRLMIDVELWYFLYCGSGHVDLEGALDRFYFISLLEEGELSRSTQFVRLTWQVSISQPACVLTTCCHLHSARALRPCAV